MPLGGGGNHQPEFINFYDPFINAPDHDGRTLSSILAWPDSTLELCHDYIQHLFPLPEWSPINPSAPIISSEIFAAFRERSTLRSRLRQSFARLLTFYGLEMRETSFVDSGGREAYVLVVVKGLNFEKASRKWVTHFDHNHLRITRIIRCLRILGLEKEAEAFFQALGIMFEEGGGKISKRSFMFWTRAARRPLWLAPEDEDDGGVRRGFLWDFEEGKMLKRDDVRNEIGNESGKGEKGEADIVGSSSSMTDTDKEVNVVDPIASQDSTPEKSTFEVPRAS